MRKAFVGFLFSLLTMLSVATASPAAAQRISSAPAEASTSISARQGPVQLAAYPTGPCGYYARHYSYYNHCGSGWIQIRVEFWWGLGSSATTCVGPGITRINDNMNWRGGITYAYYTGRRC